MNKPLIAVLAAALVFVCLLGLAACSGPSVPSTALVRNLTKPGATDFFVGEQFEVVVTGAPNQIVIAAASQNGTPPAKGPQGRTDKNGRFTLTGTIGVSHVGNWREQWQVGEIKAPSFTFEVKPGSR